MRMKAAKAKEILQAVLAPAGIVIDGNGDSDIRVRDERFYERVFARGALGVGEAYMDGWWETDRLDVLAEKALSKDIEFSINDLSLASRAALAWGCLAARVLNQQNERRCLCAAAHYNLDNELFRSMLDKRMVYSCAYWKNARTLDEAQEAKLELVCKKLYLRPGMRVLDIGCGWGSFTRFAAENYGVSVVGITISREQSSLAEKMCAGLPVQIRLQDYRGLGSDGAFDAAVSLGMLEHVGFKNYRRYMSVVKRNLKPGALFLIQTIGGNVSVTDIDAWFNKYIFPRAMLPSVMQIARACEGIFVIEDWHNFGPDYDKTLMAWFQNLDKNWNKFHGKYGETFYRMWKYYLLTCAGAFRARKNQLWQIVLSDSGVRGGYVPVR
ncbi:MAG TPA: cyclopropane fatty acyl phospholipid synthase [Proteobacteria bacterium]|nr:cyclopropane fatty acyl phospholipid synthase [Pseudomonadota bacterium]